VGLAGFSSSSAEAGSSEAHIHGFTTVVAILYEKHRTRHQRDGSRSLFGEESPVSGISDGVRAWE